MSMDEKNIPMFRIKSTNKANPNTILELANAISTIYDVRNDLRDLMDYFNNSDNRVFFKAVEKIDIKLKAIL